MPKLTAVALTLWSGLAVAAPGVTRHDGVAYAASGGVLYTESHWVGEGGRRTVLYRCHNGQPFARKQVSDDGPAPDFELVDARAHYREGVRGQGNAREVFSLVEDGREASKALPQASVQVIDAGFDSYVRRHWAALVQDQDTRIAFLVPARLSNLALRIQPLPGEDRTHRFKLALDAWYGAVAPSIIVTYDNDDRRLMRFEGVGNIRDARGTYPRVRIEFPAAALGRATEAQMRDAATLPLVDRCAA